MKRLALAIVIGLVAAAAAAPGVGGQTVGGSAGSLVAFRAEADSYGLSSSVKILRALPLPVEAFAPRTRAQIDSQPRGIGFGAPIDIPAGELLGLLGIPVTPPTFCYSYFPTTPDNPADNQCGVVPFDPSGDERSVRFLAGAASTHTRGDFDEPERTSAKSQAAGNFLQTPAMSIGTVSTKSVAEVVDGLVIARTEVVLGGVNLAGVVKIDAIKSSAVAYSNGTPGATPPSASFVVEGMTVASVPVELTPEGLRVGKVPGLPLIPVVGVGVPVPDTTSNLPLPVAAVLQPLVEALNGAGISFGPFEPPVEQMNERGTQALAEVKGLTFGYADPATGDFVELRLGVARAEVNGSAATFDESGSEDSSDEVSDDVTAFDAETDGGGGDLAGDAGSFDAGTGSDLAGGFGGASTGAAGASGAVATSGGAAASRGDGRGSQGLVASGPATVPAMARINDRLAGMYAAGAVATLVLLGFVAMALPARRRAWSAVMTRR